MSEYKDVKAWKKTFQTCTRENRQVSMVQDLNDTTAFEVQPSPDEAVIAYADVLSSPRSDVTYKTKEIAAILGMQLIHGPLAGTPGIFVTQETLRCFLKAMSQERAKVADRFYQNDPLKRLTKDFFVECLAKLGDGDYPELYQAILSTGRYDVLSKYVHPASRHIIKFLEEQLPGSISKWLWNDWYRGVAKVLLLHRGLTGEFDFPHNFNGISKLCAVLADEEGLIELQSLSDYDFDRGIFLLYLFRGRLTLVLGESTRINFFQIRQRLEDIPFQRDGYFLGGGYFWKNLYSIGPRTPKWEIKNDSDIPPIRDESLQKQILLAIAGGEDQLYFQGETNENKP